MPEDKPTQLQASVRARSGLRSVTSLAYILAVLAYLYGSALAFHAYDKACAKEVDSAATNPLQVVGLALIMIIAVTVPTWLTRSHALVFINLCLSLLTAVFALSLLFTASTPPYECFTMGGNYEDHVSGVPEFTLYSAVVIFVSYVFLLLDWSIWGLRNLARALKHG
jgi:hypothetical protein